MTVKTSTATRAVDTFGVEYELDSVTIVHGVVQAVGREVGDEGWMVLEWHESKVTLS
jgi:hypothetical protein